MKVFAFCGLVEMLTTFVPGQKNAVAEIWVKLLGLDKFM